MGLVDQVASVPLFEGLPRRDQERLAMIVTDQPFARGQGIFLEGEDAAGFYVVLTGKVKVFKLSADGKEQTLHIFGPGEPIGEVPVFSGQRLPANAEAMEESRLLFFPRDSFVRLIRENPSVALNMLAVLSMRLRRFTSLIEDLSLREVPGRLAAYLLFLSRADREGGEVTLDMTKAQLASLLGTIPETLSRILGKLARSGLIESEGRVIRILDREGLEALAEGGEDL